MKKSNTKSRIVEAAWALFYEVGYDATTVEDIVTRSATSKGSFYHYFEGKDALLETLSMLFDEKYEEIQGEIAIEEMDAACDTDIDDYVSKKESRELLSKAMEKINPEYAAVLRLVYFEDMTGEEAAKVLGKNKKQTANLLYRAKISLRHAMEEEGYSHEE